MAQRQLIIQTINDNHAKFIEEYINNGHNGVQAYLKAYPNVTSYQHAAVSSLELMKRSDVQTYLSQRQNEIKERANIKSLDILHKLQTWLTCDPTDFIGLTPDNIKELPMEVRQCIQDIEHTKKEYTDRQGNLVVDHKIKVKLVDKTKAADMISKHIGLYALDNKQKGTNVNVLIQNLATSNPEALNALLNAAQNTPIIDI
jgi:phage terminase small subunit